MQLVDDALFHQDSPIAVTPESRKQCYSIIHSIAEEMWQEGKSVVFEVSQVLRHCCGLFPCALLLRRRMIPCRSSCSLHECWLRSLPCPLRQRIQLRCGCPHQGCPQRSSAKSLAVAIQPLNTRRRKKKGKRKATKTWRPILSLMTLTERLRQSKNTLTSSAASMKAISVRGRGKEAELA